MLNTRKKILYIVALIASGFCNVATANTLVIGQPILSTATYTSTYTAQKGESKAYAIAQAEEMAKLQALDVNSISVNTIDTEGNVTNSDVSLNKKIISSRVLATNYGHCAKKSVMCATVTVSVTRDNRSQLEIQNAKLLAAINTVASM